jgi:FkbM family methyltransferase
MFARKARPAPPTDAAFEQSMRRLFRVLHRHNVTLVVDIGAGVGRFGLALRAAGYRGRMLSIEPGLNAHSRLCAIAAHDPQWLVAPRALVCETNQANLLPLSTPIGYTDLALGPKADIDELIIGDEPVDLVRLDSILDQLDHPAENLFVVIENAGEDGAVLDGAGVWIDRVVGWHIELPLLPLTPDPVSPDAPGPYLQQIAQMGKLGYVPILFGAGYFSIHACRQVQMSGVFIRQDRLQDPGL